MSKFKVGDRVKFDDGVKPDFGTITGQYEDFADCYWVKWDSDGNTYWISEPHIKLVEEVKQETSTIQDNYDIVSKPKHYMLFEDKGIEVRNLMQVLANRLESKYSSMFISDYIQMLDILRFDLENAKEDLSKAKWYLEQLISNYKELNETR